MDRQKGLNNNNKKEGKHFNLGVCHWENKRKLGVMHHWIGTQVRGYDWHTQISKYIINLGEIFSFILEYYQDLKGIYYYFVFGINN